MGVSKSNHSPRPRPPLFLGLECWILDIGYSIALSRVNAGHGVQSTTADGPSQVEKKALDRIERSFNDFFKRRGLYALCFRHPLSGRVPDFAAIPGQMGF